MPDVLTTHAWRIKAGARLRGGQHDGVLVREATVTMNGLAHPSPEENPPTVKLLLETGETITVPAWAEISWAERPTAEFETNELAWLLGLATKQRRKRERETLRRRPGQTDQEFREVEAKLAAQIAFARHVEDKLVLAVAAADHTLLRVEQRERLRELGQAA
jgi:hypothetical protein